VATVLSKLKDFSRSQAETYRLRCESGTIFETLQDRDVTSLIGSDTWPID